MAGDRLTQEEMAALVRRLKGDILAYCPHGRPVRIAIPKKELEKRFERR
jgi:DNA mismatch repair ATPase MutL